MTILPIIPLVAALAVGSGSGPGGTHTAEKAQPSKPAPARTVSPRHGIGVRGKATYYDYHRGQAAAGPALRRALGKHWRGMLVYVCANNRCVKARLTDSCQCYRGERRERLIDLDPRDFKTLAPLWRGVIDVKVTSK